MVLLWVTACTNTSSNRDTHSIHASYRVTSDASGQAHLGVDLRLYGLQLLELSEGDSLTVEVDGHRRPVPMVTSGRYEASLGALPGGTEVKVDLEREEGESALGTTVTVPTPFEIEPLEQEEYSSSEALLQMIAVRWSPPALGYMGVQVEGECIHPRGGVTLDVGNHSLLPIAHHRQRGRDQSEPCEVIVTLTRTLTGRVPGILGHFSDARAEQVRRTSFVYNP